MILITGATGFVGNAVLNRIASAQTLQSRATARRPMQFLPTGAEAVLVDDLTPDTDWRAAVNGVEAVVHAAARVHIMQDSAADPLAEFRRINVAGTLNLARQAAEAGVRRFIFISSIKVNGEQTQIGKPYTAEDIPSPVDPYGISKYEAEQGLRELSLETGMEVVVIRPVLVYGPGVKANFLSMMRWLYKGVPLPFGAIHNQRSFVGVDNLSDLIFTCLSHQSAANQTFLVSDGEDLSTPALLRRTAQALGRPAHLLGVPSSWFRLAAGIAGKPAVAQRICGSLQVDIRKTRELLEWKPPVSVTEGLKRTAAHFLTNLQQS